MSLQLGVESSELAVGSQELGSDKNQFRNHKKFTFEIIMKKELKTVSLEEMIDSHIGKGGSLA